MCLSLCSPVARLSACDFEAPVPPGPPTRLSASPVPPGHPTASVAAVLQLVDVGELVADAPGVAALRAHQCDEGERAQVHLQELLQRVRLQCALRAPGPVRLLLLQPGRGGREGLCSEFKLTLHSHPLPALLLIVCCTSWHESYLVMVLSCVASYPSYLCCVRE